MSNQLLFQMCEQQRRSLIDRHLFYVEQARKRLLSQFDDIGMDADRAADEWLERRSQRFDPDHDDPDAFCEAANDIGIEFYGLLSDMRERTYLSIVAGMFHEWEKQLREWLVNEIQRWHSGDTVASKVWSVHVDQTIDLLESIGWNVRNADYFHTLDACRLVVNVYKHGKGKSLDELRLNYPKFLVDPFKGFGGIFSDVHFRNHTHLMVNDEQFQEFSNAIVAFWKDVPENVYNLQITDVPDWLEKAIQKDRSGISQRIST